MRAHIDGDIIAYACAFAGETASKDTSEFFAINEAENRELAKLNGEPYEEQVSFEPLENVLYSVKHFVENRIVNYLEKHFEDEIEPVVHLSSKKNFRNDLYTEYKANRSSEAKPTYLSQIKKYLTKRYNVVTNYGYEADDTMGIFQTEEIEAFGHDSSIICTIDKDLDNIEGWHYNWNKDGVYFVNKIEADRNFYKQCLVGDPTDNIPGVYKVTGKKATKKIKDAINEMETPEEMWSYVVEQYGSEELALRTAQLIWICRTEEIFHPPSSQ